MFNNSLNNIWGLKTKSHKNPVYCYFVIFFPYSSYQSDYKLKRQKKNLKVKIIKLKWDIQTKYFPGQFSAILKRQFRDFAGGPVGSSG